MPNLNEPSPNKSLTSRLSYPKKKHILHTMLPIFCQNFKPLLRHPSPISLRAMIKKWTSPKTYSKRPTRPSLSTKSFPNKSNLNWPSKTRIWENNLRDPNKKSMSFSKVPKSTNIPHHSKTKKPLSTRAFNATWETPKWKKCWKQEKNKTFCSNKGFANYNNKSTQAIKTLREQMF